MDLGKEKRPRRAWIELDWRRQWRRTGQAEIPEIPTGEGGGVGILGILGILGTVTITLPMEPQAV